VGIPLARAFGWLEVADLAEVGGADRALGIVKVHEIWPLDVVALAVEVALDEDAFVGLVGLSCEKRSKRASIKMFRNRNVGGFKEGRQEVDIGNEMIDVVTPFGSERRTDEQSDFDPRLVDMHSAPVAAEAMIGSVDNQGVIFESQLLDGLHEATKVAVHVLERCVAVRPTLAGRGAIRLGRRYPALLLRHRPAVALRHHAAEVATMGFVGGEIEVERV